MENNEKKDVMEGAAEKPARKPRKKSAASSGSSEGAPKKKRKREEINVDDYLGHNTPQKPREDILGEEKTVDIQTLIDKAKAKGTLSNTEIMMALGNSDYDIDQIDKLYEALEGLGIDVTEYFNDEEKYDEDIENDLENYESADDMEQLLAI